MIHLILIADLSTIIYIIVSFCTGHILRGICVILFGIPILNWIIGLLTNMNFYPISIGYMANSKMNDSFNAYPGNNPLQKYDSFLRTRR